MRTVLNGVFDGLNGNTAAPGFNAPGDQTRYWMDKVKETKKHYEKRIATLRKQKGYAEASQGGGDGPVKLNLDKAIQLLSFDATYH